MLNMKCIKTLCSNIQLARAILNFWWTVITTFFFLISRIFHIVFSWDCHPFPWFLPLIRFSSALFFASNGMNNNRVWNFIMNLFAKKHTVAWTDLKKSSLLVFWNLVRHEHTIQIQRMWSESWVSCRRIIGGVMSESRILQCTLLNWIIFFFFLFRSRKHTDRKLYPAIQTRTQIIPRLVSWFHIYTYVQWLF